MILIRVKNEINNNFTCSIKEIQFLAEEKFSFIFLKLFYEMLSDSATLLQLYPGDLEAIFTLQFHR